MPGDGSLTCAGRRGADPTSSGGHGGGEDVLSPTRLLFTRAAQNTVLHLLPRASAEGPPAPQARRGARWGGTGPQRLTAGSPPPRHLREAPPRRTWTGRRRATSAYMGNGGGGAGAGPAVPGKPRVRGPPPGSSERRGWPRGGRGRGPGRQRAWRGGRAWLPGGSALGRGVAEGAGPRGPGQGQRAWRPAGAKRTVLWGVRVTGKRARRGPGGGGHEAPGERGGVRQRLSGGGAPPCTQRRSRRWCGRTPA